MSARNVFGGLAFGITAMVICLVLLPVVSDDKEKVAYLIVGNVLAWPLMILQYFFGTSKSSSDKNDIVSGALVTRQAEASAISGFASKVAEGEVKA